MLKLSTEIAALEALALRRLPQLDVHASAYLVGYPHAVRIVAMVQSHHAFPQIALATAITLLQQIAG